MTNSNSNVVDWIIAELKAGRSVLVPVKLYDSIQAALQYNEIAPALRARVIARDVRPNEVQNLSDKQPEK